MCEKFRPYLLGQKFVCYTDNNLLKYLRSTVKLGAGEQRWETQLAMFDYEIKYRPGSTNKANALSRLRGPLLEDDECDNIRTVNEIAVGVPLFQTNMDDNNWIMESVIYWSIGLITNQMFDLPVCVYDMC